MPEPGILFTILSFLALLTILVFVHEWGHYIVARSFGVRVDTFSIGFGREIFGWTDKKKTRWKISWLPLGGYVKFHGDASVISNPQEHLDKIPQKERDYSFHFKPLWQRTLIVAAGPLINIFFAAFIFIGVQAYIGEYAEIEPVVSEVTEGSPAEQAGFALGDRILEVEGKVISKFDELRLYMKTNPGRELDVVVSRDGQLVNLSVTPTDNSMDDGFGRALPNGTIGITGTLGERQKHTVFTAISYGIADTKFAFTAFFDFIGRLFQGNVSKHEIGGPIKIAQYTGQAASVSLGSFIMMMAYVSISLGIINLFPIPLLDGGHLLFYSIEAVKGSPISAKAQEMAAMLGLAFVLTLLFVVTWNDLNLPGLG